VSEYTKKVVLSNLVDSKTKKPIEVVIGSAVDHKNFIAAEQLGRSFGERFKKAASDD